MNTVESANVHTHVRTYNIITIQWSLSNPDTLGTEKSVHISKMS